MGLSEDIQQTLGSLRGSLPEITGAIIASTDGLAIAHDVHTGDPNRMAAMVATALGLGKRISDTFGGGALQETSVSGESAQIYVYSAGSKGVLAITARTGANVGLIHLESRAAAKKLAALLG